MSETFRRDVDEFVRAITDPGGQFVRESRPQYGQRINELLREQVHLRREIAKLKLGKSKAASTPEEFARLVEEFVAAVVR